MSGVTDLLEDRIEEAALMSVAHSASKGSAAESTCRIRARPCFGPRSRLGVHAKHVDHLDADARFRAGRSATARASACVLSERSQGAKICQCSKGLVSRHTKSTSGCQ